MYYRMFVAPLFLVMLLVSQALLLPSEVFATCCTCGNCWMQYVYGSQYCYCGGNCGTCLTDAFDPGQLQSSAENPAMTTSIPDNSVAIATRADITERVMDLISGADCFRSKVALSLLGHARDDLRYRPAHFEGKRMHAIVTVADNRKEVAKD